MKNRFKFLAIILIAIGIVSCSEEFLESEPTQFISADKMAEVGPYNPGIFNGLVSGLYSLMYQTGTGGTNLDHDDFGQKGYDIYTDLLSGDMVLAGYNYGWYKDIATMAATIDYTDLDNYKPWRYYYRIIRAANTVIDGLGGNDAVLETDIQKFQMGQAKAMRAYSYFYLAQLFAKEYDPVAEILPIYTSTDQEAQPLSTGADVWALIKSDLEDAVLNLDGYQRAGKHEVDVDVANALLAYTNLTMGNYTSAITAANAVINSGKFEILPQAELTSNGFNNVATPSWVWGMDLTLDQGLDLVSWWGQVDVFTYSYAAVGDPKTMDMGLFNSINATDTRKAWFGPHPWYGDPNCPLNKFYDPARKVFTQREVTTDYVYMRIEEMYLVKAEAQAKLDADVDAQNTLFELVSKRDSVPDYVKTLTGNDLDKEIYKQWRIEMWGEGKSYLAMKRNKATIVRQGHIEFNDIPINYNDDRLTFEIPYNEIQDNPNISFQD